MVLLQQCAAMELCVESSLVIDKNKYSENAKSCKVLVSMYIN